MDGIYCLHTNGSLIYKKVDPGDLDESTLVVQWWPVDTSDRGNAWKIALEASILGADDDDLKRLAERWGLTFEDSLQMLQNTTPTEKMKGGLVRFIDLIFKMSFNEYWTHVGEK